WSSDVCSSDLHSASSNSPSNSSAQLNLYPGIGDSNGLARSSSHVFTHPFTSFLQLNNGNTITASTIILNTFFMTISFNNLDSVPTDHLSPFHPEEWPINNPYRDQIF